MRISTVIITLNEEANIFESVKSAFRVSDEVLVIDAESSDKTVELATKAGAKVIVRSWKGYGDTKNFGHTQCKNNWILSLDGDEVLSDEFIHNISALNPKDNVVYEIDIQTYYFGKALRHSGFYPLWKKRLFNKNNFNWNTAAVHEALESSVEYSMKKIEGKVYHYSFKSREQYVEKLDSYARLGAQRMMDEGRKPGWLKKKFGPAFRFFKTYILDLGVLDGRAGYEIALMNMQGNSKKMKYFEEENTAKGTN